MSTESVSENSFADGSARTTSSRYNKKRTKISAARIAAMSPLTGFGNSNDNSASNMACVSKMQEFSTNAQSAFGMLIHKNSLVHQRIMDIYNKHKKEMYTDLNALHRCASSESVSSSRSSITTRSSSITDADIDEVTKKYKIDGGSPSSKSNALFDNITTFPFWEILCRVSFEMRSHGFGSPYFSNCDANLKAFLNSSTCRLLKGHFDSILKNSKRDPSRFPFRFVDPSLVNSMPYVKHELHTNLESIVGTMSGSDTASRRCGEFKDNIWPAGFDKKLFSLERIMVELDNSLIKTFNLGMSEYMHRGQPFYTARDNIAGLPMPSIDEIDQQIDVILNHTAIAAKILKSYYRNCMMPDINYAEQFGLMGGTFLSNSFMRYQQYGDYSGGQRSLMMMVFHAGKDIDELKAPICTARKADFDKLNPVMPGLTDRVKIFGEKAVKFSTDIIDDIISISGTLFPSWKFHRFFECQMCKQALSYPYVNAVAKKLDTEFKNHCKSILECKTITGSAPVYRTLDVLPAISENSSSSDDDSDIEHEEEMENEPNNNEPADKNAEPVNKNVEFVDKPINQIEDQLLSVETVPLAQNNTVEQSFDQTTQLQPVNHVHSTNQILSTNQIYSTNNWLPPFDVGTEPISTEYEQFGNCPVISLSNSRTPHIAFDSSNVVPTQDFNEANLSIQQHSNCDLSVRMDSDLFSADQFATDVILYPEQKEVVFENSDANPYKEQNECVCISPEQFDHHESCSFAARPKRKLFSSMEELDFECD